MSEWNPLGFLVDESVYDNLMPVEDDAGVEITTGKVTSVHLSLWNGVATIKQIRDGVDEDEKERIELDLDNYKAAVAAVVEKTKGLAQENTCKYFLSEGYSTFETGDYS